MLEIPSMRRFEQKMRLLRERLGLRGWTGMQEERRCKCRWQVRNGDEGGRAMPRPLLGLCSRFELRVRRVRTYVVVLATWSTCARVRT